jgi:hypothetical protein
MKRTAHRTLLAALATATVLGMGSIAHAQAGGALWEASRLPETRGTVKQYTLTPRGDIDGLILNDGTEVKLPPHLTGQVAFAVRPGDAVTIRDLKATATILDNGPPDRATTEQTISGRVAAILHGKRGEVNGAVLDNGTNLRLPPPDAERLQQLLAPGSTVTVRGSSLATPLGTVVDVSAIGTSPDGLTELAAPPQRGGPGEPGPRRVPPDFGPPPRPPRG